MITGRWRGARVVTQLPAGVQAAHAGHLDVEDHQVEVQVLVEGDVQGGLAVRRQDHPVARTDQDPLDQPPDVRIVIRRQDQCHDYPHMTYLSESYLIFG